MNGENKKNIIPTMLEGNLLSEKRNLLHLNESISIIGVLNSYIDKNKQNKFVVNCESLKILDKNNERT